MIYLITNKKIFLENTFFITFEYEELKFAVKIPEVNIIS